MTHTQSDTGQSFDLNSFFNTGDLFDLEMFCNNIKFDDWQLKILDDVEQNVSFKFIWFADDNMPRGKETSVYEVFSDGESIGICYGRRSGAYVINSETLRTRNDPGSPAFFAYTKTPFRSEKDAFMRSTAISTLYCDKDYQWDNVIDEAWYPTFDSLYELLEHHRDET